MAEPISIASGVLALATFGVQATASLLQVIKDFKRAPSTVRQLKEELEALITVLQSLEANTADTETNFAALKTPLYRCSKACQDFEAKLSHFAGRSNSAKANFQDWTKLKYLGSDINGFKDMVAGYKATISIALCNINLRSSVLTRKAFNEYKEMISNTTYDLQNRLHDIDGKLQTVVSRGAEIADDDQAVREQMQEEKESILKCLEICENVSDHVAMIQNKTSRHVYAPPGSSDATRKPAVEDWIAAANNLAGCKSQLEARLQRLGNMPKHYSNDSNPTEVQAHKEDLLQEIESLQKSIIICQNANEEADRNRTNVFEDINMGDDGRQVIASTVGDLIFARKVKTGARSVQVLGQMSDMTIQHVTKDRDGVALRETPHRPEVPGEGFEDRYGTGRDLRPTKPSNLKPE